MIKSFKCKETNKLFNGERIRNLLNSLQRGALRKLKMLDAATQLDTLRIPPGNLLEVLKGDLKGYHSIRINDQFRIVFIWENDNAFDVEIIDYH